jgi:AraC family transcriptional regulator
LDIPGSPSTNEDEAASILNDPTMMNGQDDLARAHGAEPVADSSSATDLPGLSAQEAVYAPGERMPRHAHPELALTLVLSGCIDEAVSRSTNQAVALSVGVKPAGTEHANRFGPGGTHTVCVTISDAWLNRFGPLVPEVRTWRWLRGGAAVPVFVRILEALKHRRSAATWLEPAVIDLIAALADDGRLRPGMTPPWLGRARERLLEDVGRGVTASELAADAGMHPVSLARAFRRHYGESMSECLRRARMQVAARALEDETVTLTEAAAIAGLADQSHLTRLCRTETGLTPRGLRRLQATG